MISLPTNDSNLLTGEYGLYRFTSVLLIDTRKLTVLLRPLPQEMLDYARSDTHFLLFIYDNLRNALLDCSQSRSQSRLASPSSQDESHTPATAPAPDFLLREVLTRSEDTALRVYEKEVYDAETGQGPGGWDTLAKKWNKGPMGGQEGTKRITVYKKIHAWRDRVAREEDESTRYNPLSRSRRLLIANECYYRYILPNHYLFLLSERPPNDLAALLAMFTSVPPVIRRRAKELMDEIRTATQAPASASTKTLTGTETASENVTPSSQLNSKPVLGKTNSPLNQVAPRK